MNELLKALAPARRRLRLRRLLQGAGAGFASGALAALVLLTVTSFVPLYGRWLIAGAVAAGCILLGALGNAARPVAARDAALAADACGLRERCVTALELAGNPESEMTRFQRQDACEHLKRLDVKQIPLRFPRRMAAAGAGLLVLCAATLLLPGGGDRAAAARKALEQKTAAMEKAVDEAAALEEAGMDEKQKAELRKLTEDLKRELRASRDELDAMVALDKAEQRLGEFRAEQMREKTAGDARNAMEALSRAMENAGMDPGAADAMAQAMADGNAAAMSAALGRIDAGQLKELSENLSGDVKSLAEQLAEAAGQGGMTDAQLQAMMSGMSGSPAQAGPMQQALSGMKGSLGAAGQSGGEGVQASGGMSGGNNMGQAGSGAGTGTTNEEQKGSGSSGQQQGTVKGNRPAEFKQGKYETIYDPEKAETASRDVMTEQNSLERDSVQIETGPGKGTLEGDVPFRQVVGEYAAQEALAAESAHLTREQKEWVDEYFRLLTDE